MRTLWQDIRYASRMLRKNPGFTVVAVMTLALGIGATTAIVSVVKIAVFDPLPVSHPDWFLQLGHVDKEQGWSPGICASTLRDAQWQTNLFAHVAAYHWDALTLPGEDFLERVPGMWVTMDFFRLWKVLPLLGRMFAADEGQPGKDDVFVISHRLWRRRFGRDPAIVGRTVFSREKPMTVVVVMPPHFSFPNADYGIEHLHHQRGPAAGNDDHLVKGKTENLTVAIRCGGQGAADRNGGTISSPRGDTHNVCDQPMAHDVVDRLGRCAAGRVQGGTPEAGGTDAYFASG